MSQQTVSADFIQNSAQLKYAAKLNQNAILKAIFSTVKKTKCDRM